MGQGATVPQGFAAVQPWMTDDYAPMGGPREGNEMTCNEKGVLKPITNCSAVHNAKILKTGALAVWTLVNPVGDTPCSRTSHFSVFDPERNRLYIGYGLDVDNNPLDDIWAFDLSLQRWAKLPISGESITPRSGARATILSHYIVIFGGYANQTYLTDFHIIDLNTFQLSRPQFGGTSPTPRTFPMVAAYNGNIYVWGGYNGQWPSELYVLDLNDKIWNCKQFDVNGRTGFPYIVIDNKVYIHGGSRNENAALLVIDLKNETFEQIKTLGTPVPTRIMNSSLVDVGPFFILIGGRADDQYSFAYAYHKHRNTWFLFYVVPDGETVTQVDGFVTENGIFKLPRNVSVSLVYNEPERTVCGFLGAPHEDPPPTFRLYVGDYIGYINLQDDMLNIFSFGYY